MQIHYSPHSKFFSAIPLTFTAFLREKIQMKFLEEAQGFGTDAHIHKMFYILQMFGFASAENAMPAEQNKWIIIYYFGEWRKAIVAK